MTPAPAPEELVAQRIRASRELAYLPADVSYYLAMRDGVRVALSLWFPHEDESRDPRPVIFTQTRYGRAGLALRADPPFWLQAGFVFAALDVRGSTSSFGPRDVDLGPEEVDDMDEVIAHLAAQPWCDGRVIAEGRSYLGNTADIATSRPAPALKGAVLRHFDFDTWRSLARPGGVYNKWMVETFGAMTLAQDEGRSDDGRLDCLARPQDCAALFPTLSPVDNDPRAEQLRAALRERRRWPADIFAAAPFWDSPGLTGHTLPQLSPVAHLEGMRRENKPAQCWASWMDAGTAESALARFRALPHAPLELWITANDHREEILTDPLRPDARDAPNPSVIEQRRLMEAFVYDVLAGAPIRRRIRYAVLGDPAFRETTTWPPEGVRPWRLHLLRCGFIAERAGPPGRLRYAVDPQARSGGATRWTANYGVPADYPDMRGRVGRVLAFEASPLDQDLELAGYPEVALTLHSSSPDPQIFVYLELRRPDGTVAYLTEAPFALRHRREAASSELPYPPAAVDHTFRREHAQDMPADAAVEVRFSLQPVAARLPAGSAPRLVIAGADASVFDAAGPPAVLTIELGRSWLSLPVRPWVDEPVDAQPQLQETQDDL